MRTKVSGSHCESSRVNVTTATQRMPARPSASIRCSLVIRSGGALSGRTTRGGCGSKVIAMAMPPRSTAPRFTRSRILRCPRWRPSKLPSASTGCTSHGGRGSSGK